MERNLEPGEPPLAVRVATLELLTTISLTITHQADPSILDRCVASLRASRPGTEAEQQVLASTIRFLERVKGPRNPFPWMSGGTA